MIIVCGETLFDMFVANNSDPASSDRSVELQAHAGGSPFNVAVGLARLGQRVALSSELGEDLLGHRLLHLLQQEGVDTSLLRQSQRPTAIALVDCHDATAPSYSFYGLRDRAFSPGRDYWRRAEHRQQVSAIHVGSLALLPVAGEDDLLHVIAHAPDNALIALDPNVRLAVEPDAAIWRTQLDRFAAYAHLIKASEEDLHSLYGPEADLDRIAQAWFSERCRLAVVTSGAAGATFYTAGGNKFHCPALPVDVADSIGAGDSFQAALLCWLVDHERIAPQALAGLSPQELRALAGFATQAAAATCSRRGAALPYRAELLRDDRA